MTKEKRVKLTDENLDRLKGLAEFLKLPLSELLDRLTNKAITSEYNKMKGGGQLYVWKS
jgi:hypothetical protein